MAFDGICSGERNRWVTFHDFQMRARWSPKVEFPNALATEPRQTSLVWNFANNRSKESVMKLRIATLTAVLLLAANAPNTAEARGFGMHGGFGHVGGWGHGGWGHGGLGWGGIGLGLATGALVGAALATPYYGYGYPYGYDYYGYDAYPVAYDYGYAPAYSVGYVGPYWGARRHYWAHRHYGYRVGLGGYRAGVAYGGYHRAAFRSYG